MIYITAIHMDPASGTRHEHIAGLSWQESGRTNSGDNTRAEVIDWINHGIEARVRTATSSVQVGVVNGRPPYLRTHANGTWTDNLLNLSRY